MHNTPRTSLNGSENNLDLSHIDLSKFKKDDKEQQSTSTSLIPLYKISSKRKNSTHQERIYKFRMQRLQHLKKDIAITKNQIEKARNHVRKDLMPIIDRIATQKYEFVKLLDETYQKDYFTFRQKEHIRKLIEERSYQLLYQYRFEPARKLYKKYVKHNRNLDSDVFESVNEAAQEFAQAVSDLLFKWEKDKNDSEKKRFDINKDVDDSAEKKNFKLEDSETQKSKVVFHTETKKTFDTRQALRLLYTRLAKDLHPDLEPDQTKKAEKNEVMRRLTEAYKNEDLYELLQIQFQYNAEDYAAYTEALAQEQLTIINETLLKQIKKLQEEYKDMTVFGEDAALYRQFCTPDDTEGKLTSIKVQRHKEGLVFELLDLKDELQIMTSKEKLEAYLKSL